MAFLLACQPDLNYEVRGYTQKIIVEGIIETGKYPEVYLSLNVPLWKQVDSTTILEHVIRYAKVTVSDGEKTEILTSKWAKDHFPPYVYKCTEIVGREGYSYDLKVEYSGYTLYSTTTIPSGFQIESANATLTDNDTLRALSVKINVDKHKKNSFRIFTKNLKDKRYIQTPMLFNDELELDGLQNFNISPSPLKSDSSFTEGNYFAIGDTVEIKICAIDSVSTLFFKDITLFSSLVGNSFMSEVKPLHSNISEPGFGIWYGNAVRTVRMTIK
jgi:hypothetical protein